MVSTKNRKNFNPFPGLRPFSPEESDLFFGRENESTEVLKKLQKNRFVTVIGASGTGKSSLIYCGVLEKIKNLRQAESSGWKVIAFRPGNEPFENLADALLENKDQRVAANKENLLTELQSGPGGISSVLKAFNPEGEKILLIIDQFEEFFRFGSIDNVKASGSNSSHFIEYLVATVNQGSENIYTIVTMRSDFIGECSHYQGLTQLINNSNYLVPHMGTENYREAIVGPIKYAGAEIDPKLIEILLNDIGDRTDQLPVLQHALMRTWTFWQELDDPGRPINQSDYDSVGTMKDAMSRHANEAYEELSTRGKEICEKLFRTLTEKGSDNKGIRHPSGVSNIKSIIQCTSQELFEVVEKFRITSRSFLTPRNSVPLTDDSIIDLSHESLMRLWDRLRTWVDDEAASVQMYLRLSDTSAMFQQGRTSLWRPPDLQLAINWREHHKPTLAWAQRYDPAFERAMVYLRTSEKAYLEEEENKIRLQKRQIRRTKIVATILGVAAIISVGFMLFAFVQKIAADRQTLLAEERRIQEEKQRLRADSTAIVANQQRELADSSALVARINEDKAQQQKLIADSQRSLAERNANEARLQETIALEQSDSAKRASLRAVLNARLAEEQKIEALRLRMLSIGKSMSIKSLQAEGQKDLQSLLAYQAFLFNRKNNGIANDADIYAGLYNFERQYGETFKAFKGHNGEIKSIAFVPGKNEFYSSGYDGKVLKWIPAQANLIPEDVYSGADVIEILAVSPDASWLACGSSNSKIMLISLKNSSTVTELIGHTGKVKSLRFSGDSKSLYSAALDNKVFKWDLSSGTSKELNAGGKITSVDISSDAKYLAGVGNDGIIIVSDTESGTELFRIRGNSLMKVVRFKPDEAILAAGDNIGNIELWDVSAKRKLSSVKAHTAQVNDIDFNSRLMQMATASNDKSLKIWNITNPEDLTEPPITFNDNEDFVMCIKFSPDGQSIVSGTYDGIQNLVSRPSHVNYLVQDICTKVSRNMTQEEWNTYVGRDIPLEKTCTEVNITVNTLK